MTSHRCARGGIIRAEDGPALASPPAGYVLPEQLDARKLTGYVTVSPELLADAVDIAALLVDAWNAPPLTPEQLAERQRERDDRDARNQAAHRRLLAIGGIVAVVADIHTPAGGYCSECGDEDPQLWPCDTAQALIDHLAAGR